MDEGYKYMTVLHSAASTNGPRVRFSRESDELGDIPETIYIARYVWKDMGQPKTITVTVEPDPSIEG